MKNFKKMMAFALAMVMVLSMSMAVFAGEGTGDGGTTGGTTTTTTTPSITVNSPIVGTTYNAYKVFDMTTNATVDSFSYTIKGNNPFFNTVMAYANMPAQLPDANADGLTLTVTADTANAAAADKVYNVAVTDDFDPQKFGQALLKALQGTPADDTTEPPTPEVPAIDASSVAETPITVTNDNATSIKFDNLALGYFLITSEYPKAEFSSVTMTEKKYDGTDKADPAVKHVYDKDSLVDPTATDLALTQAAKDDIALYVEHVVDDAYVAAYIADKGLKDKDADGNEIEITNPSTRWTEVKNELIDTMKADAEAKILAALKNQLEGSESDINLAKEPILVFLDSSQPVATINEKNEIDKWDTPVNPSGDALPEDLPDHGEPDGGKNIVINEDPAVYADWSEASIGDSIHYQLRVNAMNFVREGDGTDQAVQTTADKVKQVKEYNLLDYQSAQMHYDTTKGLKVRIIDGNGANVTSNAYPTRYKTDDKGAYLDYSDVAATKFFVNNSDPNVDGNFTASSDIFGSNNTGIVVPWVIVSAANPSAPDPAYPVYTESKVKRINPDTNEPYKDDNGNDIIDTYYVYSIYKSDVTIVVDYYMILDDDAIIDGAGNKNFAQYGYSPVEPKNETPNPPSEDDKPSEKKEVDDATVYTYALAFVKIDDKGEALADAKFELPFYVKKTKAEDGSYIYAFDKLGDGGAYPDGYTAENCTNTLTTPANGVITIKGVTADTYSITETEAPEGYNKLAEPFEVEAQKTGEQTITTTTKTIYLDAQGNVTSVDKAVTTITKHTSDSNLPVYQFMPVVNKQGTELPSTGGIGTTIFYVIGAILVLGAGILLVTRRRMNAN